MDDRSPIIFTSSHVQSIPYNMIESLHHFVETFGKDENEQVQLIRILNIHTHVCCYVGACCRTLDIALCKEPMFLLD